MRATFHEITKEAVMDAIEHPSTLQHDLVDAQQARRVLDRLVGYYLSPVLWKKVRRGLSAGRVQSVALRLIVEREKEIRAFVPEAYWEVDASMFTPKKEPLTIRLINLNDKEFAPTQQDQVDDAVIELNKATYAITDVQKTERTRASLPPFTTSTLQQAAANKLGWSAKQAMSIFKIYTKKDALRITAPTLLPYQHKPLIWHALHSCTVGKNYLPSTARAFKTSSKNAQEAHEAIRPTHAETTDISAIGSLGPDIKNVNSFGEDFWQAKWSQRSMTRQRFLRRQNMQQHL